MLVGQLESGSLMSLYPFSASLYTNEEAPTRVAYPICVPSFLALERFGIHRQREVGSVK